MSNIIASATGTITEIEKGERGAIERPRSWDNIADGSSIQSGTDGEKYIDIVLYGTEWYQCIKSFTKGDGILPTNTIYFTKITDYQRLATNLFLAKTAYIENLGVMNIKITDDGTENGNVLLQADKDGIVCNSGTFKNVTVSGNINAAKGSVGGFTISGTGLTNTPFTNDAYIIFRNDTHKCFAGIGGNVLPASSGQRAVARFENEDNNDQWGLGYNIAAILSAKNAAYNFAFAGAGNGVLDGWIGGYKYSRLSLIKENTIYSYNNDGNAPLIAENNLWFVDCLVSNSGVCLPRLSDVRNALGIGTTTSFAVKFTIIADVNSLDFSVYGRNKMTDSSGNTPWDSDEVPFMINQNADGLYSLKMGAGDSLTVVLTFTDHYAVNVTNNSYYYTARIISRYQ